MSKDMDGDFLDRLIKAAGHRKVPFTPQSLGTFLGVDRRKAAVWMAGSMPRAEKLFEHAEKFGVDPRWYATGQGDMLPRTAARAEQLGAAYVATIKPGDSQSDVEKLLVLIRIFLDTDAEGKKELMFAANGVVRGQRGSDRETGQRRAKRR